MKITIIIGIWIFLGFCGYLMLRQGSLVSFESCLGKQVAWGYIDVVLGMCYILSGPIFILHALLLEGMNCFRKRPSCIIWSNVRLYPGKRKLKQ